jgi:signal transduction histidine kinase
VSKRPTTGGGPARSVMRRMVGYLRDRSIGFKLGLILLVPTLATVVVGIGALAANVGTASDADRARILAGVCDDAGHLVHNLQNERAAATLMLAAHDSADKANATAEFNSLVAASDAALRDYNTHKSALTGLPDSFRQLLSQIDDGVTSIGGVRQQLGKPGTAVPATAIGQYSNLIGRLLAIRDSSAQLAGDAALSYEMRSGAAIAQYKEFVSQERIQVLQILDARELTPQSLEALIGTHVGQQQALDAFKVVATQNQQTLEEQTLAGPDVRQAVAYSLEIRKLSPGTNLSFTFSADVWDRAMTGWSNQARQLEQAIDQQTTQDAKALRDTAQGRVYLDGGLLAALVLFAVLIAWLVARSMTRSLKELRHGALGVAQYGLPQAVARLRDPALSSQMSPHEVAQQIAEPLPVRSRDEFGQVTEAFNAVHLEAVRTAAEQAALRSSVSTMFVNLARRSQILVDRLIGHLDRLERGEEDPDRLAELFQLDHLATRMRRNDENLLVLAGADSTRVQREPAALIDVLRAAQSEVEHYTRIEFGVIDRDIECAAHAVNDLVHLVAELFDNATAFSPPDSTVIVEARRVGDRAVLYVEDHGIGISPDQLAELNERLATPPMVDVAVSRMMGLVVVARLAARHGVKVELRPAPERGTVADVLLPTAVLVPRALSGRGPTAGSPLIREMPAPGQPVPPRAPFTSPLALESGPTGGGRTPAGFGAGPAIPPGPSMGGFGAGPNQPTGPIPMPAGFGGGPTPPPRFGAEGNGRGSAPPHLPPWSDLTGATNGSGGGGGASSNGADLFTPHRPPSGFTPPSDPLPQRRATERPVEGELTDDDRRIPRQVPASPEARPVDRGEIDAVDADVIGEQPAAPPAAAPPPPPPPAPAAPPPAWPPVPAGASVEPADAGDAKPPVPDELAAARDITSEIPRVRPDREPEGPGWNIGTGPARPVSPEPPVVPAPYAPPLPQQPAEERLVAPQPARVKAYADETMELPIFRELESAWFRTRPSGPDTALTQPGQPPVPPSAPPPPAAPPVPSQPAAPPPLVPQAATPPPVVPAGVSTNGGPQQGWGTTAADDGWTAASQAADPQVDGTTSAGLPRRVPMAQLVPGGVEKATASANRRSPEQVRGLLSAYHRGVQRGRTRTGDDAKPPESSTTGNPPQGGKEQEA